MRNTDFIPIDAWKAAVRHYQNGKQQALQEIYLFLEQKFKPQIQYKYGITIDDFLSVLDDKLTDLIIRTIDQTIQIKGQQIDNYLFNAINNIYLDRLRKQHTNKAKKHQLVALNEVIISQIKQEEPKTIETFEQEDQEQEALLQGLKKVISRLNPIEKVFVTGIMEGKKTTAIIRELGHEHFLRKIGFSEDALRTMSIESIKKKASDKSYYFVTKLFEKMRNGLFQEISPLKIKHL